MRVKTSVTLPSGLLEAIDKIEDSRSAFLEKAAIAYLTALDRRCREARDLELSTAMGSALTKSPKTFSDISAGHNLSRIVSGTKS